MEQLTQCRDALWALLTVSSVAFSLLVAFWRACLTTRYVRELLDREIAQCSLEKRRLIDWHFKRCAALQKSLWESFLREPVPTLNDLVERTERDWQRRQSARSSTPPPAPPAAPKVRVSDDSTIELTDKDL